MPQELDQQISEAELQALYTWVDEIPLSRPKRNIARDFSDGVLVAEVIHHFFPRFVELHNYSAANSMQQKMYNWNTLNQKVFKRLGFTVSKKECEAVANCQPGSVEALLKAIKNKIAKYKDPGNEGPPSPPPALSMQQHPMPEALPPPSASNQRGPPVMRQPSSNVMMAPPPMAAQQVYMPSGGAGLLGGQPFAARLQNMASQEALVEKDHLIAELRETNEILETKVRKLEQLVRLKDAKIQTLMAKLQGAGLA